MDDIDLLPDDLRQRSFSDKEIVFPYQEALLAIDHIVDAKWGLLGWEGWVKRDQGLGHHQDYQGTVNLSPDQEQSWEEFVQLSADFCRSTMKQDQQRFDNDPDCRDMTLLFCLSAIPQSEIDSF